jgi:hypothetical protein
MVDILFKKENGLIYYCKDGYNWKMAGRENHPLTKKFIQLLKGEVDEDTCICEKC